MEQQENFPISAEKKPENFSGEVFNDRFEQTTNSNQEKEPVINGMPVFSKPVNNSNSQIDDKKNNPASEDKEIVEKVESEWIETSKKIIDNNSISPSSKQELYKKVSADYKKAKYGYGK